MITRIWRGRTLVGRADEYSDFLIRFGVPDYRAVSGNLGATLLRRSVEGTHVEFVFLSYWRDWNALREYAGPNPEIPNYFPTDREYLLELEPRVQHFEIVSPADRELAVFDAGTVARNTKPAPLEPASDHAVTTSAPDCARASIVQTKAATAKPGCFETERD